VLVNNAGGFWGRGQVAADGLEHTFALNHLAPFLLTSLLLDRLTASTPARVVAVSSSAHAQGRLDFHDLQGERNYSGQHARVTIVSVVRPAAPRPMLVCLSRLSLTRIFGGLMAAAERGQDRDGPLVAEGRLLSGHEIQQF
jgi:NAD(P)-dependent dehydrogenase (short-subunit alcohol dehydrogenase family)